MKTRNTKQKEILNKEIAKFKTFFSAEQLHDRIKVVDENMGMATIYRHLKSLRKDGEIYSYTCQGKLVYSTENKSHCHYICEETGKVTHIEVDSLDFLKDKIPGSITSFQIEVKGICKKHTKK